MQGRRSVRPQDPKHAPDDLADAIAPSCKKKRSWVSGRAKNSMRYFRHEARHTKEEKDRYVIEPENHMWSEYSYALEDSTVSATHPTRT